MVRFERFPYLFSIDNLQNWIMPVVVAVWNLLALVVLIFIPIAFIQNVRQLSNDILSQQFVIFIIPYLTGWVYLISGIYVFVFRKFDTAGQVFGIFSAACAIVLATTFDKFFNAQYNLLWVIMLAVAAGTLIQFALVFPARIRFVTRHPLFKWIGYALAILIAVSFWIIYSVEQFRTALVFWQAPAYVFGLAEIFFLILITWHWIKSTSPIVKEQAKLVFWGSVIAVVPFVSWMIFNAINPSLPFSPFVLFPLGFFPILTGYAIVRYSFIDIDYLISRSILYVILMALAVGSYALIVSGLSLVFDGLFQPDNPIILGLVVFIFAIGLNPVRNYFEKVVDQYFSREKHVYYDQQQEFVRELTQTLDISLIINLLGHYIEDNLSPERLHIYIFDSLAGQYSASSDRQDTKTSDIRFALDSPLVDVLSKRNEALFMVDFNDIPDEIKGEQARLALLAAQLFVPLPGRNQLIGWLAMGARRSAEPYSGRDLDFLEALCGQAALAVWSGPRWLAICSGACAR